MSWMPDLVWTAWTAWTEGETKDAMTKSGGVFSPLSVERPGPGVGRRTRVLTPFGKHHV